MSTNNNKALSSNSVNTAEGLGKQEFTITVYTENQIGLSNSHYFLQEENKC